MSKTLLAVASLAVVCVAGCKTADLDLRGKMPWADSAAAQTPADLQPVRIAVFWSDTVLNSPGKKPTRGFGGRIYFYNFSDQIIPAEGELIVYGFNDTAEKEGLKSPPRKFVITAEQFKNHYTPSDLGSSYSVWIPWDTLGGEQYHISLVPVFTLASGQVLSGEQSLNVLPGGMKTKKKQASGLSLSSAASTFPQGGPFDQSNVGRVSYAGPPNSANMQSHAVQNIAAFDPSKQNNRINTTTIHVPSSLSKQLAMSRSAALQSSPALQNQYGQNQPLETQQGASQTTISSAGLAPTGYGRSPSQPASRTSMNRAADVQNAYRQQYDRFPQNNRFPQRNASSSGRWPARFVRQTHQAPTSPAGQPSRGHAPSEQHLEGRRYGPASQQRSYYPY